VAIPGYPVWMGGCSQRSTERESSRKGGTYHVTVLTNWLTSRNDDGQGLAEYALILALIAIIAIAALIFLGGEISAILSTIGVQI
jgi:pilus assembly protein Flp/PilA